MHFLQLLPFASLALAIPYSNTKRQSACIGEPWAIKQYHTCTNCVSTCLLPQSPSRNADLKTVKTLPGATQETTSLVFEFTDSNFSPAVTATCELSVLPGLSLIQPFTYTQCGSGVSFYYDGADLNVERTGVECGK